jgi:hypothetical protein
VTGVPLRVTGKLLGGTVTGPATTPGAGGAQVAGTLPPGATAELRVEVPASTRLDLDLTAVPRSTRAAAAARAVPRPGRRGRRPARAGARRQALDLLVATAATGARATSYSPYLGADLPGTGTTVFRYAFAAPER